MYNSHTQYKMICQAKCRDVVVLLKGSCSRALWIGCTCTWNEIPLAFPRKVK